MIKAFTAVTSEIDDPKAAVKEVLAGLSIQSNLKKHAIGIISCFSEFEETGVLKAVCDALPFDCAGSTTCLCAANQQADQILFAITVITSDDCSFQTICLPIGEQFEASVGAQMKAFLADKEKPAFLLGFFPLINTISGDRILSAIDVATGGVPLFGTVAVDHNPDYKTAKTIHNDDTFREGAVLIAIFGKPNIQCEIASLSEEKMRSQRAIITASDDNVLMGVNGTDALAYLHEVGLTREELLSGLGVIPFVVDHKDGTKPVARAIFGLTPDGHAVCAGSMKVGATLGIGRIDRDDVLQTTRSVMTPLVQEDSLILSYSCMARFLALGAVNTAEAEAVNALCGDTPYMFSCSGGEICPLPDSSGRLKNYLHNFTNAMCRIS